jgi:hypothetical protein
MCADFGHTLNNKNCAVSQCKFYRKEVLWYNQEGANFILPDLYEEYIEPIPQVVFVLRFEILSVSDIIYRMLCENIFLGFFPQSQSCGFFFYEKKMLKSEILFWIHRINLSSFVK